MSIMISKYDGKCIVCRGVLPKHTEIWFQATGYGRGAYHLGCRPSDDAGGIDNRAKLPALSMPVTSSSQDVVDISDAPSVSAADVAKLSAGIAASMAMAVQQQWLADEQHREIVRLRGVIDEQSRAMAEHQRMLDERMATVEQKAPKQLTITTPTTTKTLGAGTYHYKLPLLVRAASVLEPNDRNIWLTGPAGSGKTTAAHQLATILDLPYEYHGAIDTPYKLSGYIDATGNYHGTAFRRIYENGGVILLDECDASSASALLELNAAISNSHASFPDRMVARHKDCYVIAAANTWGLGGDADYVGTARLNAAFLDRFVTISWGYDESLESALSLDDAWTSIVQQVRQSAKVNGAKMVISPRASIKGGQLLTGCTKAEVAELVFGRYQHHSVWPSVGRAAEDWCRE
jgi:hypothetical protein